MSILIRLLLALLSVLGFYIPAIDLAVYSNEFVRLHEEGHRLDWELGMPSQDPNFKEAIRDLPAAILNTSCLIETESCLYSEAYAKIYAAVGGKPETLPEDIATYYVR